MAFDPKKYLAEKEEPVVEKKPFDPKAYLAAQEPEEPSTLDTALSQLAGSIPQKVEENKKDDIEQFVQEKLDVPIKVEQVEKKTRKFFRAKIINNIRLKNILICLQVFICKFPIRIIKIGIFCTQFIGK